MEHNEKLIFSCSSKRLNDFSSELSALNLPHWLQLQFLQEFLLPHFLCACSAYNSLEIRLLTSSLYVKLELINSVCLVAWRCWIENKPEDEWRPRRLTGDKSKRRLDLLPMTD
ncbi:hypothetical protein T4B_4623 [Trichinella pseudospiralis]|uniref:Uncharacterized protein n=1 Tax=Trichinella pseudospiralis TaxID=6337 RepID=A0A0V1EGA1_TRIPS|nr:hypothetical protein T4A_11408 [Trichinella pseudospiralis]KRZ28074.1 hypothetical protein T4B_4623 [Trichinella pseudospiralis]KRZ33657.1 hypothetical protein T4C_6740 [Trichinella pseudospiralis]